MQVEDEAMRELIRQLPKTELHLHIEGTLEPELVLKLAHRNNIELPHKTVEEIKALHNFTCLQDFLDVYYEACSVLMSEEDFFDLGWAYFVHAHEDGVVHAEIFFDPQTHTERGVALLAVLNGLARAQKKAEEELGVSSYLILCFLRHLSEESAFKTLDEALPYKHMFKAVGLDSTELGNPASKFQNVFRKARDEGLQVVAHAGEEGPPEYVWAALDLLKVSRIDHGTRSIEDPELIDRLVREKIPLTCCPFSNIFTGCCKSLDTHALLELLERGVVATINSDDPAYFGGYLLDNFYKTCHALKCHHGHLQQLCENSINASFLPQEIKDKHLSRIRELCASCPPCFE